MASRLKVHLKGEGPPIRDFAVRAGFLTFGLFVLIGISSALQLGVLFLVVFVAFSWLGGIVIQRLCWDRVLSGKATNPRAVDDALPQDLIEKSYAALAEEQRTEIEGKEPYQSFDRAVAVAIMKRRLEFLRSVERQEYETPLFRIRTERAGGSFKIAWQLLAEGRVFELLGFRNTGGFYIDRWDENKNGTLIIDSQDDGEIIDPIGEGLTYFYTFFLVDCRDGSKLSPLRFQVTLSEAGTKALLATIRKLEGQTETIGASRDMSKALKELGLVMEFHDAIDSWEKNLIAQIKQKNLPKDEEDEKIAFVREAAAGQRDKYQPKYQL